MFDREVTTFDQCTDEWAPSIRHEIRRRSGGEPFEVALGSVEPASILNAWRDEPVLFYWAARDGRETIVASGVADRVKIDRPLTPAALAEALRSVECRAEGDVRYYGGLRFDPATAPEREWAPYGTLQFFRPKYEVRISGDGAVLRVTPDGPDDELGELDRWHFGRRPSNGHPLRGHRSADNPDRDRWHAAIAETLRRIRQGDFEKAVLARAVDVESPHRADAVSVLEKLAASAPSCYHMLFRPEPGTAFVAATPERLIGRRGSDLVSEAVAGTRPRSLSEEDDARLRDELLASDKDRREHAVVGRSILEALQRFVTDVEIEEKPSEMRLANGRHLKSAIRATLEEGVRSADVVAAVHPTPAVGGYPTPAAVEFLREIEPFDRGWYAGAIGWIGAEAAELAVGIRSALVRDEMIRLYSGAGIVEGSQPESEWEEIEQKIDGFLKVLRIGG